MNFHTFGAEGRPSILLIHGGGNAWWNYLRQARRLAEDYHVILPTLDGHGEEYDSPYLSTGPVRRGFSGMWTPTAAAGCFSWAGSPWVGRS